MTIKISILSLLLCLLFAGCETSEYSIKKPEGFAEYKKTGKVYNAISAEGIRLRVYTVKNEPYGNPEMWMESVNIYLKSRGYKRIDKRKISGSGNIKGFYTEYIYRYYGDNYIYSLTIFDKKDNLYLIESGGIDYYYKKRKKSIIGAIKEFKIGK